FLRAFLNSPIGRKLFFSKATRATAVGLRTVVIADLHALLVPVVDPKWQTTLNEIERTEVELKTRLSHLETSRGVVFEAQDKSNFHNHLTETQRRANLLLTSLQAVDSLNFQIGNFYPFPIAYGYRLLASEVNPDKLYKQQLRVAENLLAFLASVSIAL